MRYTRSSQRSGNTASAMNWWRYWLLPAGLLLLALVQALPQQLSPSDLPLQGGKLEQVLASDPALLASQNTQQLRRDFGKDSNDGANPFLDLLFASALSFVLVSAVSLLSAAYLCRFLWPVSIRPGAPRGPPPSGSLIRF